MGAYLTGCLIKPGVYKKIKNQKQKKILRKYFFHKNHKISSEIPSKISHKNPSFPHIQNNVQF